MLEEASSPLAVPPRGYRLIRRSEVTEELRAFLFLPTVQTPLPVMVTDVRDSEGKVFGACGDPVKGSAFCVDMAHFLGQHPDSPAGQFFIKEP